MKTSKGRIAFSEQRWEMIYDAISSYVHFMIAMGEWGERDPLVSDYHGILKIIERRVDRGVKENKISFKVFKRDLPPGEYNARIIPTENGNMIEIEIGKEIAESDTVVKLGRIISK